MGNGELLKSKKQRDFTLQDVDRALSGDHWVIADDLAGLTPDERRSMLERIEQERSSRFSNGN